MKDFLNQFGLFTSTNSNHRKKQLSVFTQLFAQMNISICDTTLSIYPKISGVMIYMLQDGEILIPEKILLLTNLLHNIGKGRFVNTASKSSEWRKHNALHDDTFSKLDLHFHYEFEETIHEAKLTQFLQLCLQIHLISSAEYDECIYTFNQANKLHVGEYHTLLSRIYLADLKKSIDKYCRLQANKNTTQSEAHQVFNQLKRLTMLNGTSRQVHQYIKDIQLMIDRPTHENIAELHKLSVYKKEMQIKLLSLATLLMPAIKILLTSEEKHLRIVTTFYLALLALRTLCELPQVYRHYKWVSPPEGLIALCKEMQKTLEAEEVETYQATTEMLAV